MTIDRPIISVGGIDGSGKSSFARRLAAEYDRRGLPALLLHVDDFRHQVDWKRGDRSESELYGEDYFDFAAIEGCLDAFRAGAPRAQRPLFDSKAERVSGSAEIDLSGIRVAVVEGVFMMRLPSAEDHVRVWIRAPFDVGRRRIIERGDPPWRTVAEWNYRIDTRYFPAQVRYEAAFNPEERADVVIDNQDWEHQLLVRADLSRLPSQFRPGLEALLPF